MTRIEKNDHKRNDGILGDERVRLRRTGLSRAEPENPACGILGLGPSGFDPSRQ
jgi:hypothetical protein